VGRGIVEGARSGNERRREEWGEGSEDGGKSEGSKRGKAHLLEAHLVRYKNNAVSSRIAEERQGMKGVN
jgi:hypothetical protein